MLNLAAIVPHPPIIIPDVRDDGIKQLKKTIKAMEKLADDIAEINPDTIIFISPHGIVHSDRFAVYGSPKFTGDLSKFGASSASFHFENDVYLAQKIVEACESTEVEAFQFGDHESEFFELDHGVVVPMYYLSKKLRNNVKILPIAYSYLSKASHFEFGQIISSVCNSDDFADDKIVIIASGDLSHRLLDENSPYYEFAKEFDTTIVESISLKSVQSIFELDGEIVEKSGECGYNSILILLGALDKLKYEPTVLSYEAPFGIGHIVAEFNIKTKKEEDGE